jgi:hypothetical protein
MRGSRPTPVRSVAVALDGVMHKGTYYVQGSCVYVQYEGGTKMTQVGAMPAESLAKLLLLELVREQSAAWSRLG